MLVDTKKISGNAFVIEDEVLCHHGTLLVDADLSRLSKYLNVSDLKLKSKGIDSVVSRVTNIKAINESITVDIVKEMFIDEFKNVFELDNDIITYDEKSIEDTLVDFENRYQNWSWNYGSTPNFEVTFEERFSWGQIQINFNVDDAFIKEAKVYTDCNDSQLSSLIEEKMLRHKFDKVEILKTLKQIDNSIINDVCNLFETKMF